MSNQKLVLLIMAVITAAAWYSVINNQKKDIAKYNEYLADAENYAEKGIYIDAVKAYESAYEMNPSNYDLLIDIFNAYINLNDDEGMKSTYKKAVDLDPENDKIYISYAEYYQKNSQFDNALNIINKAKKNTDSESIDELYEGLIGKYQQKYVSFSDYYKFCNGYFAVYQNEKWGIFTDDMNFQVKADYDQIGCCSKDNQTIPVNLNGDWYYIDVKGNKKLVPDNKYSYMGSFSEKYAPAQRNGKYGYVDNDFKEYDFNYDYCGAFESGIAAVKKAGKWAVIGDDLKTLTKFEFDDIILDDYGFCSYNGLFFAKKDGAYSLFDKKGKKVGSETFSNAKLFVSEEPAAVCKNGKWGFLNKDGEIVIKPEYDDANSFSQGLAPVSKGGKWGYIDDSGKVRVDYRFKGADCLSEKGFSVVKEEYGSFIALEFLTVSNKD